MTSSPIIDGHAMAEFRARIRASDAVVLSAVYSGRAPPPASPLETPAAAVARIAPAANRFQFLQLGICLLNESDDGSGWIARPFTIDVFPAILTYRRDLLSKTLFDCDAVHMKALSDRKFPFNRVFHSGMNWFSPKDEAYLLEKMKRKRASDEASINDKRSNIKISDPKDKAFIDIAEAILNTFCETSGDVTKAIAVGQALLDKFPVSDHIVTMSVSSEGRLVLMPGNGFLRRLLHQMIGERHELISQRVASPDIRRPALVVLMSETREADRSLVPSEVLRRKVVRELDDADHAAIVDMQEQVGFRYILEEIVKAGKPILADDLLELLLHFEYILMGELGDTYAHVKDSFVNHWTASSLYDTTSDRGKASGAVKIADGFEKFARGFDSLEAGAVALQRAAEINLERIRQPSCSIVIPETISEICLEDECDNFLVDTSALVVFKSELGQSVVDDYAGRQLVEVRHQGRDVIIVEAKSDAQRLISEVQSRFREHVAVPFRDFAHSQENNILPSTHQTYGLTGST